MNPKLHRKYLILYHAGIDKCNPENSAWTEYNEDCCTTSSPCGEKQGGCTADDQCGGTLVCTGSESSCGSEFDISKGEKCCHVPGENSIVHLKYNEFTLKIVFLIN